MLKTIFFKISLLVGLVSLVSACDNSDEPTNSFKDEAGIACELRWTTGETDEQAAAEANLDIYLYNNLREIVGASTSVLAFEELIFASENPDDVYIIAIEASSIAKRADYVLEVSGVNSSKSFQMKGAFTEGTPDGSSVDIFKVKKSGSKYTVVRL